MLISGSKKQLISWEMYFRTVPWTVLLYMIWPKAEEFHGQRWTERSLWRERTAKGKETDQAFGNWEYGTDRLRFHRVCVPNPMGFRDLGSGSFQIGRFPSNPVPLKSSLQPYKSTDSGNSVPLNTDHMKQFFQHGWWNLTWNLTRNFEISLRNLKSYSVLQCMNRSDRPFYRDLIRSL